tara:strand:- start:3527 stop:3874 length:348 start_codon:yes stop_codon:yes gene_type:complete
MKPPALIKKITSLIQDKKGYDIKIIDLKGISSLTDFFIVCSSDSDPQTRAITNHIKKELSKFKIKPFQVEGLDHMEWILMDYFDIVVHVFKKETRDFYDIERLWADAKIKIIKND